MRGREVFDEAKINIVNEVDINKSKYKKQREELKKLVSAVSKNLDILEAKGEKIVSSLKDFDPKLQKIFLRKLKSYFSHIRNFAAKEEAPPDKVLEWMEAEMETGERPSKTVSGFRGMHQYTDKRSLY
jgi:hypothetical protein